MTTQLRDLRWTAHLPRRLPREPRHIHRYVPLLFSNCLLTQHVNRRHHALVGTSRQPEHRPRERRVDYDPSCRPSRSPSRRPFRSHPCRPSRSLSPGPSPLFSLGTRHDRLVRAHVGPGPGVGAGMGYKVCNCSISISYWLLYLQHDQEAGHDPMHDASTACTTHRPRAQRMARVHDASPACMTRRSHARRIARAHDASLVCTTCCSLHNMIRHEQLLVQ